MTFGGELLERCGFATRGIGIEHVERLLVSRDLLVEEGLVEVRAAGGLQRVDHALLLGGHLGDRYSGRDFGRRLLQLLSRALMVA